jgi:hypothetical protein
VTVLSNRLHAHLLQIEGLQIIGIYQQAVDEPKRKRQNDFCPPQQ